MLSLGYSCQSQIVLTGRSSIIDNPGFRFINSRNCFADNKYYHTGIDLSFNPGKSHSSSCSNSILHLGPLALKFDIGLISIKQILCYPVGNFLDYFSFKLLG